MCIRKSIWGARAPSMDAFSPKGAVPTLLDLGLQRTLLYIVSCIKHGKNGSRDDRVWPGISSSLYQQQSITTYSVKLVLVGRQPLSDNRM